MRELQAQKPIVLGLIGIVCAICMYGLYEHVINKQVHALPRPTGEFAVGTTTLHLVDTSRQERHNSLEHRELMVQAYYPIEKTDHGKMNEPYLKQSVEYVKQTIADMKKIATSQLAYVNKMQSHSLANALVSSKKAQYPVILFSPGFGSPQETYTVYLEELASQGFIVLGINHPYVTNPTLFPDGKVIAQSAAFSGPDADEEKEAEFTVWLQDITFVINELKKINTEHAVLRNKLNLARIGAMGHSFGGRAVVEACRKESRIKAGIDLDGKLTAQTSLVGFDTPFMFIVAERKDTKDQNRIEQLQKSMKSDAFLVIIKGADHGTFTDLNLVFKPWLYQNNIDPIEGIRIVRSLIDSFFDIYLDNNNKSLLESTGLKSALIAIRKNK